jgi:hypothetical protein
VATTNYSRSNQEAPQARAQQATKAFLWSSENPLKRWGSTSCSVLPLWQTDEILEGFWHGAAAVNPVALVAISGAR